MQDELDMIQPAAGAAVLLAVPVLAVLPVLVRQLHNGEAGGDGGKIGRKGKFFNQPIVLFATLGRIVHANQVTNAAADTQVSAAAGLVKAVLGRLEFGGHFGPLS